MTLPVYTELSNFNNRINGRKVELDFSIVLIINGASDPVDSINSIFQFMSKSKYKSELIFINVDKEGYKYDKLLSSVPMMRVLLPQSRLGLREAIMLGAAESLSRNILFLDEHCAIKTLNLEVMDMYLSEPGFGIILPLLADTHDTVIPNIIKGEIKNGFLKTFSTDIVGTSVTSLFSKYFCFILNREAFLSRNIEMDDYEDPLFTGLELGYRLWKEGFIVSQARIFKAQYNGKVLEDIELKLDNPDYIRFCYQNITSPEAVKGRWKLALSIIIKAFYSWKIKNLGLLLHLIKNGKKFRQKNQSKPVEDFTIISIIKRDLK
jgi:hypothetical protein